MAYWLFSKMQAGKSGYLAAWLYWDLRFCKQGKKEFYFFEGNTDASWPTHDPCGKNVQNQKKGVKDPGGQIYHK